MINVYFDENPNPVLSISSAGASTIGPEGFAFGAGSTAGQIDMAFDWITATDVGAFGPAEEFACLGRSLVLDDCPMPFADADEDGDVDMDDFAALQRCINNGAGLSGASNCNCFDRGHDGDVDAFDLLQFATCATGPAIPWSQELTPACQP